jgi:hypothetical protein
MGDHVALWEDVTTRLPRSDHRRVTRVLISFDPPRDSEAAPSCTQSLRCRSGSHAARWLFATVRARFSIVSNAIFLGEQHVPSDYRTHGHKTPSPHVMAVLIEFDDVHGDGSCNTVTRAGIAPDHLEFAAGHPLLKLLGAKPSAQKS